MSDKPDNDHKLVRKRIYVVIGMDVTSLPDNPDDLDDVIETAVSEADYNYSYDQDGVLISNTEVLGWLDEAPPEI